MTRPVIVAVVALLVAGCSTTSATPSTPEKVPSAPVTTPKDSAVLPLIEAAALEPCPEGHANPDAAVPGLPSVTYRCLGDGPDVNLAGVRGTPLVVNVWASWCPPCIAEMPLLTEAAADLRGQVRFLGINIQDRDGAALEMLTAFGTDFPSVVDESGEIRALMGIPGPPVTFFVNDRGVVTGRHDGFIPSSEYLDELLNKHLGVDR